MRVKNVTFPTIQVNHDFLTKLSPGIIQDLHKFAQHYTHVILSGATLPGTCTRGKCAPHASAGEDLPGCARCFVRVGALTQHDMIWSLKRFSGKYP